MLSAEWIKENGVPFSSVEYFNDKNKHKDVIQNLWFKLD